VAIFLNPFTGQLVDSTPIGEGTKNGTINPSSGQDAAIGSVYVNTSNQTIWIKTGSGSTDWVDVTGSGASGNVYKSEIKTLTGTDITNKYVTLLSTPSTVVTLLIQGGVPQAQNSDFTISTNQLDWNGSDLDGVLTAGDRLLIQYS